MAERLRVAIVHGYFLGDSGSAVYSRELARELARLGHEVTLICQEQHPGHYDFIDCVFDVDARSLQIMQRTARERLYAGSCRLVRPAIGERLLTYVAGPFPPFSAIPFQDAEAEWIKSYASMNVSSLAAIFQKWPQDLIQANHAVMQPWVVMQASNRDAPYVVTIHGSELNFTVRKDPRMVPYMVEGLAEATAVAVLSETSRLDVVGLAEEHGLSIAQKTTILPPGVDTSLFGPVEDRSDALAELTDPINPAHDDIAVFAGRLLWTKGLQYALAALPIIMQKRPGMQLIAVGDGPMREPLERMLAALDHGDLELARYIVSSESELAQAPGYGPVIPDMDDESEAAYLNAAAGAIGKRLHFTGHLAHKKLAQLFAAADISLAPSVFPEAFGLVSIEALAAGAIPVATYQSGLRTPLDVVTDELSDELLRSLTPEKDLTAGLAGLIVTILNRFPTTDLQFREKLHQLAEREFSWAAVARGYLELAG